MAIEILSRVKCFDGWQVRFAHDSATTHCRMTAAVYLPPQVEQSPVPVLYWLSGLTCTDENFVTKAGAQQYAAQHGIAVVAPDTSPRGESVADDEAYDFGQGAGFYVAATQAPWATHYQMYDYVRDELPRVVGENFPLDISRQAISGHSMGGHGALTIALKNAAQYRSVSAFAPICSPPNCPWGQKALRGYLGNDESTWQEYDTCHLLRQGMGKDFHLLVEQGLADPFLQEQLKPQLLKDTCRESGTQLTLNEREDYDHSYYFIASFIGEHIAFHAKHLK